MDLTKIIDDLSSSLFSRTGILTEDNVRYCMYYQMLKQDPDLNHYTLELPYESIKNGSCPNIRLVENFELKNNSSIKKEEDKLDQELDMYYDNGLEQICIEVKFHRHINKTSAYAHTMAAGKLVNDFRRLQQLNPSEGARNFRRLILYVTDAEMHNYMMRVSSRSDSNSDYREALKNLYCNGLYKNDGEKPKTFLKHANASFCDKPINFEIKSQLLFERSGSCPGCTSICPDNPEDKRLHIRLYEVQGLDGSQAGGQTGDNQVGK